MEGGSFQFHLRISTLNLISPQREPHTPLKKPVKGRTASRVIFGAAQIGRFPFEHELVIEKARSAILGTGASVLQLFSNSTGHGNSKIVPAM